MSKEIKSIPVSNPQEALLLINKLSAEFGLTAPEPARQFIVSNEHYSAFYDAGEKKVKMETVNPDVTEEQIREFLINFPPFF